MEQGIDALVLRTISHSTSSVTVLEIPTPLCIATVLSSPVSALPSSFVHVIKVFSIHGPLPSYVSVALIIITVGKIAIGTLSFT